MHNDEDDDDYQPYEEEEDKSFIGESEARPHHINFPTGTGHYQTFKCEECGSYNTSQGTHYDMCHTCGWSQGY